jgi:hypothetical protein
VSDQNIILNPHATFAGQINSRLNGYDHTGPQFFIAAVLP